MLMSPKSLRNPYSNENIFIMRQNLMNMKTNKVTKKCPKKNGTAIDERSNPSVIASLGFYFDQIFKLADCV